MKDDDLKQLLTQLLDKLEAIEGRLKEVEKKAHDQVTPVRIEPYSPPYYPNNPVSPPDFQYMRVIC